MPVMLIDMLLGREESGATYQRSDDIVAVVDAKLIKRRETRVDRRLAKLAKSGKR